MRSFKISVVKFLGILVAMLMLGTVSTFAQVNVTLPTVYGTSGEDVSASLTVGSLTGQNVKSFQFTLDYDKSIVYLTGASAAGTIIEDKGLISVNADTANGKLIVAWANADAISGSGALLYIDFHFRNAGVSTLDFNGTFMFNNGTPSASVTNGSATTASIVVQGGSVSAVAGDNITIPIHVTAISAGNDVRSYQFNAAFDKNVINITGANIIGTLSEPGQIAVNPDNTTGTVSVAWANAVNITGSGVLLNLTGTAVGAGTTNLDFTSFMFNNGTPTVGAAAGAITVVAANVAPTLTLNPSDTSYTIAENANIQIQLVGSDTPGDVLTYSMTGNPTGATLSAGGLFSWTPSYDQGRTNPYVITFKVTDQGGLSDSMSVSITVTNVNRAPSFTAEPANNTVVPVHNVPVYYTFQYQASDPDGDTLTFSLVSGPGTISATGFYSWAPVPEQAGQPYVVTVQVSDGAATVTSTRTLKVADTVTGIDDRTDVPTKYELNQNYPNPFNPTTTIEFALPQASHVRLTIYNVLGQEVTTLIDRSMGAGYHSVNFNASNLNTGMYLYKIEAGSFVSVKKMLLIK